MNTDGHGYGVGVNLATKSFLQIRVHPCPSVGKNSFESGPERRHLDLTSVTRRINIPSMSVTEIINELPKLTEAELRLVRQRLLELAAQNQDIELCNQAALDGAMMLDRMQDDDARRQSR
ncbi:MAG: hypothetical protein DME22_15685 [Verrucomicrobia bacterium]|nr:MAG: hypothetical protein DME22_15685 [Verrucomicrobiota bacterium]PYK00334.1 MAG: hypothetical protein DME23_07425 [Verrucomicrobiota bacterium]